MSERRKFWISKHIEDSQSCIVAVFRHEESGRPEFYIPVIETLPGDCVLSREEVEKVKAALGRMERASFGKDFKTMELVGLALELLSTERGEG